MRTLPREQASVCISPLQERIRDLEARMANLDAEKVALELSSDYLWAMARSLLAEHHAASAAGASGTPGAPVSASAIVATAQALHKSAHDNLARTLQLAREKERLQHELKPLLAEKEHWKNTSMCSKKKINTDCCLNIKSMELHCLPKKLCSLLLHLTKMIFSR